KCHADEPLAVPLDGLHFDDKLHFVEEPLEIMDREVKRDKYEVQMIMQFNEIHKFSDDTLHQIDEALDYRVKEFKVNRINLGLNTRFWTRKDVDISKEFMFAIQKQLKTRRIFRNLESFVGERVKVLKMKQKRVFSGSFRLRVLNIQDEDEVGKIPRTCHWKEHEITVLTMPPSFIGSTRRHLYGQTNP
nr:putative reverse transcriptase domain-containing protein [Tanacetum cinerariifolium]